MKTIFGRLKFIYVFPHSLSISGARVLFVYLANNKDAYPLTIRGRTAKESSTSKNKKNIFLNTQRVQKGVERRKKRSSEWCVYKSN